MYIPWESLKKNTGQLYCYCITLSEGVMIKNRAYYHVNENFITETGNHILDKSIKNKHMTCFSLGFESDGSEITKYDLHLDLEHAREVYATFSEIDFFEQRKIDLLEETIHKSGHSIENRIIGVRLDQQREIKNICLYYRSNEKLPACQYKRLIKRLRRLFGIKHKFCLPKGQNHFLYLIALDFYRDQFKVKFYFHFRKNYKFELFDKAFRKSPNGPLVHEIIQTNGLTAGFQVSAIVDRAVTYNFYLVEPTEA